MIDKSRLPANSASLPLPSRFALRRVVAPRSGQRGAALVVVLLLLLVIIVLGVSAIRRDTIQNRIVGIDHNQAMAFQAASAALHDAQVYLAQSPPAASAYTASCSSGLCLPAPAGSPPVWETDSWGSGDSIAYGAMTGAAPLQGVPAPRYIIERLPKVVINGQSLVSGGQYSDTPAGVQIYRITARGWGPNSQSWVELQEIYRPNG